MLFCSFFFCFCFRPLHASFAAVLTYLAPTFHGGIVFFAPQAKGEENCKIYLKGLPWDTPDEDITAFFKACGKIESVEQPKNPDGRSSGTAYVVFGSAAAAAKAVEMDGQEIGGRWLKIMMSFEKPDHARNGEVKPKPEGCTTVFIGNLSWSIDEVRAVLQLMYNYYFCYLCFFGGVLRLVSFFCLLVQQV